MKSLKHRAEVSRGGCVDIISSLINIVSAVLLRAVIFRSNDQMNNIALTFFCRSFTANLRRLRCILSPCSKAGPVGSWFNSTSSSCDDRVWSNKAVAKSWHCFLSSRYSFFKSLWLAREHKNRVRENEINGRESLIASQSLYNFSTSSPREW